MRRLLVLAVLAPAAGCGDNTTPSAPKPDDSHIRVKDSIGGGVGPVGGGRSREYEGDRRKQAEENLRKKESGEVDGWWETWGRKAGGFVGAGLIVLYLASRGSRRDGSPPAGSTAPDT